mgnify:CR=1 FL=1
MKIESTEASSVVIAKVQKPDIAVKDMANSKTDELQHRNISQMTEFEKRELPVSEKVVIEAIEKANKAIMGSVRRFEFSIHEETKEIMVKVIDAETNEVIREIPPEKILDMVAKIWEMAGLFVDERR